MRLAFVVTAAALAASVPAASLIAAKLSGAQALQVMHDRHEGMETIGKAGKAINRELTGSSPNLAAVHAGAAQIADLSRKASGWFPEGTGPDVGKTGAKPDIWLPQNKADFAAKLHNFQVAAAAFNAAAASTDISLIKTRFDQAEGTCKACHDKYRMDMHH